MIQTFSNIGDSKKYQNRQIDSEPTFFFPSVITITNTSVNLKLTQSPCNYEHGAESLWMGKGKIRTFFCSN